MGKRPLEPGKQRRVVQRPLRSAVRVPCHPSTARHNWTADRAISELERGADQSIGKLERGGDRAIGELERGADQALGELERGANQETSETGAWHCAATRMETAPVQLLVFYCV